MKTKKLLALFGLCALIFSACSGSVKDIEVTSFNIISATPRGINELYATIELGIKNPIMAFTVQNVEGTIKIDGNPCIVLTSDQLLVDGNTEKAYLVPVKGRLSNDFNPWQLLDLLNEKDFSKLTVDATAKVALRSGIGKNIVVKDMPLDKLLKKE